MKSLPCALPLQVLLALLLIGVVVFGVYACSINHTDNPVLEVKSEPSVDLDSVDLKGNITGSYSRAIIELSTPLDENEQAVLTIYIKRIQEEYKFKQPPKIVISED